MKLCNTDGVRRGHAPYVVLKLTADGLSKPGRVLETVWNFGNETCQVKRGSYERLYYRCTTTTKALLYYEVAIVV